LIIEHQLSKYIPQLHAFETVTELGERLFDSLFNMKESFEIHYWKFRKRGKCQNNPANPLQ